MNDDAVAGLYAEHCMAAESDNEFTTNHPAFHQGQMSEFEPNAQVELHSLQASLKNGKTGRLVSYDTEVGRWMVEMKNGDLHKLKPTNLRLTAGRPTTPRNQLHAVVGAAGVDTKSWTLRPNAAPKCLAGGDVPGRVLRPIAYFLDCAPAKHARLTSVEVAVLRLWTGPMSARYNEALREATLRDPGTALEANMAWSSCPRFSRRAGVLLDHFRARAKPRSAPSSRGCRTFPTIASSSCRRGPTCRLSGARRAGPTE